MAEFEQLAANALVPHKRLLPGQLEHQPPALCGKLWSTGTARAAEGGPSAMDQRPVPAGAGRRGLRWRSRATARGSGPMRRGRLCRRSGSGAGAASRTRATAAACRRAATALHARTGALLRKASCPTPRHSRAPAGRHGRHAPPPAAEPPLHRGRGLQRELGRCRARPGHRPPSEPVPAATSQHPSGSPYLPNEEIRGKATVLSGEARDDPAPDEG